MRLTLLPAIALAAACSGASGGAPPAYPEGLVDIGGDLAPVPLAPGELGRRIPEGSTITFRLEAAGQPPFLVTTEFVEVDEAGATMRDTQTELDGTPRGEPTTARATWEELESHAHFPRETTTITETEIDVPAGTFAAYRYEIRTTDDGVPTVTRLWFAKELPGPPVKMVRVAGDATTLEMTLVASERPEP